VVPRRFPSLRSISCAALGRVKGDKLPDREIDIVYATTLVPYVPSVSRESVWEKWKGKGDVRT
jgi:hypothetical protein